MPERRVCLFAQHDPAGRIRVHVLHYLRALRANGFEVVCCASGTQAPPAPDREAVAAIGGVTLVTRRNAGLDFGAWGQMLQDGHADGASTVLFANDSVYGPLWDLAPIFHAMDRQAPDAWGMVESTQGGWHLQSWFLHLSLAAWRSPAVRRVFTQDFAPMSKREIVVRGELALGAALQAEGLRCTAVHRRVDATRLARLVPSNPMHLDWRHLVRRRRVPFIKVELLRENPMRIPWLSGWRRALRGTDVPTAWIDAHLSPNPGHHHVPPLRPLDWKLRLFYLLATHDRMTALAALASWQGDARASMLRRSSIPEAEQHGPRSGAAGDVRSPHARPGDRRQRQSAGAEIERSADRDC